MAFNLLNDPDNTPFKRVRIASQAYTRGDAVHQDRTSNSVDVVPATASSTTVNIYGVAAETVAATATSLLIIPVTAKQEWGADLTNAASDNHDYQRMILTDKATVNNTGTDDTTVNAVFEQFKKQTSTRAVGRFLPVANVTA